MAPRIVSWVGNENPITSPVLSSPSGVSIVSIDTLMFDSVAEAPGSRAANATELRVKTQSLPGVSVVVGNKMPSQSNQRTDDSFPQHDKYFFRDGNITFLVDGIIYCVHRYFFSRDSTYFSNRFALLGIYDHQALPTIVSLGDIERRDFDAFLSVLYPEDFEEYDLSYEQWRSVLHLSTHWGFTSLRKLALRSIKPPTSYDQLLLARTYSVNDWVLPALTALCERKMPLSVNEARQMSIEDVILVATVRENIRDPTLRVDEAEIPRRIEAAQIGKLTHECPYVSPAADALNVQAVGVASPVNPNQSSTQGRDDDYEWDAKHLEKTAGRLETLLGEKITQVFREPPVLKGVLRENPENVMVKPPARAGETREEKVWLEAEEIANGATELAVHPKAEEAAEKEAAKPEAEMKVVTKSRMKSKREAMVEAKRKAVAEAKRKAEAEEERKAEAEAKRKAEVDTEAQGETSTTIHRFPGL